MSFVMQSTIDGILLVVCLVITISFFPIGLLAFGAYGIYFIFVPRMYDDIAGNLYAVPSRFSDFIHRNDPDPEPETEEEKRVMGIFNDLKEKGLVDETTKLRFVK